ncbi:MAG TPA: protoporphyrinogen oxidase [Acidimicrobiales bacterium]|nr:protoporphyrinogen oxidase [Acidimicrobiales bacterium]
MAHRPTAVVVGGGIAGLSAAWALTSAAPGLGVVVLESDDRLGGKLRTGEIGGRAVDLGPDAFLARRPEAVALCHEIGLGDELVAPGDRRAYVWSRRRLRALPAGLALGVPTRLGPLARSGILSPLGLGRAALDLLGWSVPGGGARRHGTDRSVADITRRRLGREVTARLVDPLVGGIHAGDTSVLSAAAVFPPLLEAAARGGSLMRALRGAATPAAPPGPGGTGRPQDDEGDDRPPVFLTVRGGLSRLVERLATALAARGVEIRTDAPVDRLELVARPVPPDGGPAPAGNGTGGRWAVHTPHGTIAADAVVLATPAWATAGLLATVDPATAALLDAIAYADVTLVTLRFPAAAVAEPLDGTGFLVPADGGRLVTACTWLTSKWPELRRTGDVLLRASVGRAGDDRAARMSDDDLVARIMDELGPVMGISERPTAIVVTRWPRSFPQYAVGHLERVAAIEAGVARLPALSLAGAALHGVGIPACIGSGRRAADAVLHADALAGTGTAAP